MSILENTDVEIYSSRDKIREELTSFAKDYLDLQTVDLTKTSFVSYMINVMSILAGNQLFYSSTVYREGFLLPAQLTDSVYNLSRWIGYTVPLASPAYVNVLFTMPLGFEDNDVTFTIPYNFQVYANDVPFTVNTVFENTSTVQDVTNATGITVNVRNNRTVTVRDALGFTTLVTIDTTDPDDPKANFVIPFIQQQYSMQQFQVPTDLEFFQFYVKRLAVTGQTNDIDVYVMEVNENIFPVRYEINAGSGNYTIINSVGEIDTIEKFINVFTEDQRSAGKWEVSTAGLFTLSQGDKKFVLTPYPDEVELTFGNGVIGAQPNPGNWVFVFQSETQGESGNIIPGSIRTADQLLYESYVPDPSNPNLKNRRIQRIKWDIVNPVVGVGGKNLPTNTEIKSNAIANLTSKGKLVSEDDYRQFELIAPELPIENNEPILKRSDLKINEVVLFSQLVYDNPNNTNGDAEIVPTRNVVFPVDSTGYVPDDTTAIIPLGNFFVPRGSTIDIPDAEGNDVEYQTIYDMTLDTSTRSAYYQYSVSEINVTTSVISDADPDNAYISIPSVIISSTVDTTNPDLVTVDFNASVNNVQGSTATGFTAYLTADFMTNAEAEKIEAYSTIYDSDGNITNFLFQMTDFLDFPLGDIVFKITIHKLPDDTSISIYQFNTIVRRDLSDFMFSSITTSTSTGTGFAILNVHDVPVILSEYLAQENFDLLDFESKVLQTLIGSVGINSKKMLTDFVNIKVPDTTGPLTNMQYNEPNYTIISYTESSVPTNPYSFDTYIVNGTEGGLWAGQKDKIARWISPSWQFTSPTVGMQVIVDNVLNPGYVNNGQVLVSNGQTWEELLAIGDANPLFNIPFYIRARITKDPDVSASSSQIVANVKTALLNRYATTFGMDVDIDRSEIVEVMRGVTGVKYVELLAPFVDIRFKYELKDLTNAQLQDYTPQLVAFTEDTIEITVLSE